MIVTDLDGTFYHRDLTYDRARFQKLYEKMKEEHIRFVVASGNQYYQLISFFDHPEEMTFISENGGYIVCEGKELFCTSMKSQTYLRLVDLLTSMEGIEFMLICGKKSSYVLDTTPDKTCDVFKNYFPKMMKVYDFSHLDDQIIKIALVTDMAQTKAIEEQLALVVDDDIKIVTSGHGCIDLIMKGIDKGFAVSKLMSMWDIHSDEVMAFGDAMNDLEMLQLVKYGFVMANGDEHLKQLIGNVLPYTNEQDGELEVIEAYFETL